MFIFSHIETYVKYLPHVEEISEAQFIVTALNTSKRHCSIFGSGRGTAALELGSASLEAGGLSAARFTIALIF